MLFLQDLIEVPAIGHTGEAVLPGQQVDLLEAAPDAMVVVNESGVMVFVNEQLENFFGYTRDEVLGQPVEMLVPEQYREQYRELHQGHRRLYGESPAGRPMGTELELYGRYKGRNGDSGGYQPQPDPSRRGSFRGGLHSGRLGTARGRGGTKLLDFGLAAQLLAARPHR